MDLCPQYIMVNQRFGQLATVVNLVTVSYVASTSASPRRLLQLASALYVVVAALSHVFIRETLSAVARRPIPWEVRAVLMRAMPHLPLPTFNALHSSQSLSIDGRHNGWMTQWMDDTMDG